MKLYYSPGACSLSCHIALQESGLAFEKEKVDLKTKKTETGQDFMQINPKGYVPTLALDNNQVLTECAVILQYIADRAPDKDLAPPAKTFDRYRLQEWLVFISTEIHKSFGPIFNPEAPEKAKEMAKDKLTLRLKYIEDHLKFSEYMMGDHFTVADGYLFTLLRWLPKANIKKEDFPHINKFFDNMQARPKVAATLAAEGI